MLLDIHLNSIYTTVAIPSMIYITIEGKKNDYGLIALPFPAGQHSPSPRGPLKPTVYPMRKREPKEDTQLHQQCVVLPGWPIWVLVHRNHRYNLQSLTTAD